MSDLVSAPATLETRNLDADFLIMGPFVRYEAVPDTTVGRITGSGRQPLGGTRLERERGVSILQLAGEWGVDYVDLSGESPVVLPRPLVDWSFNKDEVLVREEAVLPNIPPCLVRFSGPVSGEQDHPETGDLVIGFTTAGVYTLEFEAFPYMPASLTLTVKPREVKQIDLGGIQL